MLGLLEELTTGCCSAPEHEDDKPVMKKHGARGRHRPRSHRHRDRQIEIDLARSRALEKKNKASPASSSASSHRGPRDDEFFLPPEKGGGGGDEKTEEAPPQRSSLSPRREHRGPPRSSSPGKKKKGNVMAAVARVRTKLLRRRKLPEPQGVDWAELTKLMPLAGDYDGEAFDIRLQAFTQNELTALTTNGHNSILVYAVASQDPLAVKKILHRLDTAPEAFNRIATAKNDDNLSPMDLASDLERKAASNKGHRALSILHELKQHSSSSNSSSPS
mmetsp:Transcript_24921/g.80660  ORF Transcript_24921/g.80660 Transcript_24921/m.80660 type:complete len:275 (-) Transcript_24921:1700-2524(-)